MASLEVGSHLVVVDNGMNNYCRLVVLLGALLNPNALHRALAYLDNLRCETLSAGRKLRKSSLLQTGVRVKYMCSQAEYNVTEIMLAFYISMRIFRMHARRHILKGTR